MHRYANKISASTIGLDESPGYHSEVIIKIFFINIFPLSCFKKIGFKFYVKLLALLFYSKQMPGHIHGKIMCNHTCMNVYHLKDFPLSRN